MMRGYLAIRRSGSQAFGPRSEELENTEAQRIHRVTEGSTSTSLEGGR